MYPTLCRIYEEYKGPGTFATLDEFVKAYSPAYRKHPSLVHVTARVRLCSGERRALSYIIPKHWHALFKELDAPVPLDDGRLTMPYSAFYLEEVDDATLIADHIVSAGGSAAPAWFAWTKEHTETPYHRVIEYSGGDTRRQRGADAYAAIVTREKYEGIDLTHAIAEPELLKHGFRPFFYKPGYQFNDLFQADGSLALMEWYATPDDSFTNDPDYEQIFLNDYDNRDNFEWLLRQYGIRID